MWGVFVGTSEVFISDSGKALSYNNLLDLTAAAGLFVEFDADPPTLAILKHTNACGLGQADTLADAWAKAYATDRQAPFGGIIACNTVLDLATAGAISEIFTEVIVAPDFAPDALELLQQKKNLRLVRLLLNPANVVPWDIRSCPLYTSDAADDMQCVDLGGRRIIKKKKNTEKD